MSMLEFVQTMDLPALLLFLGNIICIVVVVFIERKHPSSAWAWMFVLIFLPVIGFLTYALLGRRLRKKHLYRFSGGQHTGLLQLIEEQKDALQHDAFTFKDDAAAQHNKLLYMQLAYNGAVITQNNDVTIFTDGRQKFEQLLRDLKNAKHHIHMQYYIFRHDELGQRILQVLEEKAKEGVEVRFLYDAIGSNRLFKKHMHPLAEAGGLSEVFFPSIFPLINPRLNFRNHRKIVVIDGGIGYVGGFNVGNEYLGVEEKYGYWRDTHTRIEGSAVHALQTRFLVDWNMASKEHRVTYDDCYYPTIEREGSTAVQIVSSGPDDEHDALKYSYVKMIVSAKRYVYIQSPYFVPDETVFEAVRMASLCGVEVRLMIPAVPDHKIVYAATMSYMEDLLKAGVHIDLYDGGFMHAKTIVIDDEVATCGTTNFDVRSFKLNFEVNAFLFDTEKAIDMRRIYERDLQVSKPLTMEAYKKRSFRKRTQESLARLISPIL
ncbi:cardiolipin synthase [Caryophanon latum]|uniref:Cardiolipin synthase n=2 Tax=Caryophanon latum TaxID=33977 RepID=A0A1C0YTW4_9BACL|nr:cardiolipin synthase [Caryophanon latum]OCS90618.1 cardiolipin synthase [Caryophanon latum]